MPTATRTAQEQLAEYAATLWRRDSLVEVRCLPVQREGGPAPVSFFCQAEELPSMHERLKALNLQGLNVYTGILPRTKQGGRTDADCGGGFAVWADYDHVDPRTAWRMATDAGLPPPGMMVDSGHGAHPYWPLAELWEREEGVAPAKISALVADLAVLLGSDRTVSNASRIMRCPGFRNLKTPPADAVLLYADPARRYSFADLRAAVPTPRAETSKAGATTPTVDPLITRARKYLANIPGAVKGGRNAAAFRIAAILRNDFRLPDASAWPLLCEWNQRNEPPLEERELRAVFQSGGRYARHAAGEKADAPLRSPAHSSGSESAVVIRSGPARVDLGDVREEIEAQARGERRTIPLPYSRTSDLARPLRPGTACILGGAPGVGKSFFLLSLARGVHEAGVSWRYLPLEDRAVDLKFRLLGLLAGTYETLDDLPATADRRTLILQEHGPTLETFLPHVCENPRVGHQDANGKTIVPPLPYRAVLDWVDRAFSDKCRVVFVDPLSQIDFSGRDPWREESDFCRALLGMASDAEATVVLIAHTIKRLGQAAQKPAVLEDLQGAAAFGRLCQTILILDAHDMVKQTVFRAGGLLQDVQSNRTLLIGKARNGAGTRQRIAYLQRADAPVFEELGVIAPRQKRKKKCKDQDDDAEQGKVEL